MNKRRDRVGYTVIFLAICLGFGEGVDGQCLLFHSDRMGSRDVWMAALDGTQIRLTDKPGNETGGRVTPDGASFAYYWDGNGDSSLAGLWLKDLNGSSEIKLMDDFPQFGGLTAWSPDGTKFLYYSVTGSYSEARIANLAGQDEGLFLAPVSPFTQATVTDWRAGKIVYEMGYSHSGNNRVFIANEDGTGALELSGGDHGDLVRFNSDGTRVSYFNRSNVTVINADGSGVDVLHSGITRTGFIPFFPSGDMVAVAAFQHDSKANDIYTIAVGYPHELTRVTNTQDVYSLFDLAPACGALRVLIDIKPGSDPNRVNPGSNGKIPVAILSTRTSDGDPLDFDARDVDPLSLAFGPDGAGITHANGHVEDVDGDGDLDMVIHFKIQHTGIACGDMEATLIGKNFGGQPIEGTDSIKTAGCKR